MRSPVRFVVDLYARSAATGERMRRRSEEEDPIGRFQRGMRMWGLPWFGEAMRSPPDGAERAEALLGEAREGLERLDRRI